MTWPELVEVAKPLGFVEFREGHRMYHRNPNDTRRIQGGFSGEAVVMDLYDTRERFRGPYAEVAEYLKREAER